MNSNSPTCSPRNSTAVSYDGGSPNKSESLAVEIGGRWVCLQTEGLLKCAESLSTCELGGIISPAWSKDFTGGIETDLESEGTRIVEAQEFLGLLFPPPLSPSESPSLELVEDAKYFLENVTFKVEDRFFMVPKHHFLQSTIFSSIEGICMTGNSVNAAMVLSDVGKVDFRALLKLICSTCHSPKLSSREWESVLKLATKWGMHTCRRMAIQALSSAWTSTAERVRLGREYGNPDWLLSGYIDLVQRKESLTVEEFRSVGVKHALLLSQNLRRRYRQRAAGETLYDSKPYDTPFKKVIDRLFRDEDQAKPNNIDMVDRILLARTYGISEWVTAGYFDLASRKDDITADEAMKLGLAATVKICQAKEKAKETKSLSPLDVEKEVEVLFATDLSRARRMSKLYDVNPVEELKNKQDKDAGVSTPEIIRSVSPVSVPAPVPQPAPIPAEAEKTTPAKEVVGEGVPKMTKDIEITPGKRVVAAKVTVEKAEAAEIATAAEETTQDGVKDIKLVQSPLGNAITSQARVEVVDEKSETRKTPGEQLVRKEEVKKSNLKPSDQIRHEKVTKETWKGEASRKATSNSRGTSKKASQTRVEKVTPKATKEMAKEEAPIRKGDEDGKPAPSSSLGAQNLTATTGAENATPERRAT